MNPQYPIRVGQGKTKSQISSIVLLIGPTDGDEQK